MHVHTRLPECLCVRIIARYRAVLARTVIFGGTVFCSGTVTFAGTVIFTGAVVVAGTVTPATGAILRGVIRGGFSLSFVVAAGAAQCYRSRVTENPAAGGAGAIRR